MKRSIKKFIKIIVPAVVLLLACFGTYEVMCEPDGPRETSELAALVYDGDIAVAVNGNEPSFSDDELNEAGASYFEEYSPLDELGRCGVCKAVICTEVQPPAGAKRTSLGSVTPSGWQKIGFWCRCHLIGYQLSGENANERNLITGTTRMNVYGMLPYEDMIDDYLEKYEDNHVLYEVEPIYDGDNLIASGVHMQAKSIEDEGEGVAFNVYVFNFEPGYIINYGRGTVVDDPDHQTTAVLKNKKSRWTGDPVRVDPAAVTGSTGRIKYIYYTDSACHHRTDEGCGADYNGGPPADRGHYYVLAIVSGDNWYPQAVSNTAELIIK